MDAIGEHEAHVWRIDLAGVAGAEPDCYAYLSAEERERLERVATQAAFDAGSGARARRASGVTRAALRQVLAGYTGIAASDLVLVTSSSGKPLIGDEAAPQFSVTHSGDHALIAVAAREIGVDLERDREPRRILRIARRVLHPLSVAALEALEPAARAAAFLDAWTLREAHVKAVGGGLFATPDTLPFVPDQPLDGEPRTVHGRDGTSWTVARFRPAPGTRACIVVRGRIDRILFHDWTMDALRTGGGT